MRSGFTAWLCAASFALAALTAAATSAPTTTATGVALFAARTAQPHVAPGEADAHLKQVVGAQQHLGAISQWLARIDASRRRSSSIHAACAPSARPADTPPPVADAVTDLGLFWCEQFAARGLRYRPIASVHPYHGRRVPRIACAIDDGARNAFYCSRDMSVSYDVDWFLQGVSPADPDNLDEAVVVLAHEFGHHVEQLLHTAGRLSSQSELQADCYAGVYLNAIATGARPARLRDIAGSSVLAMFVIADPPTHFNDAHWFDPGTHGDALTRRYAWGRGFTTGDIDQCAGFADYTYQPPLALGANRLVVPPGAHVMRIARTRAAFTADATLVTAADASAVRGTLARRLRTTAAADAARAGATGWQRHWDGALKGFRLAGSVLGLRDYTATRLCNGGVRHGTLLYGAGVDGTALLLDGSRPGTATITSRDAIDATLIAAANGSSALLG